MSIFSHPHNDGHEKVAFYNDKTSGLKAIIAIHNTNLGQSLGGLRMYPYASDEAALADVLQLSKGMTYKSALAGLPLGGGKAVIWGNPAKDKTDALFEAMGQFVDTMSGDYIVAQDSGVTVDDLQVVGSKTAHITGISKRIDDNGVELNGDPSPSTAYGVFIGVKAAVKHKLQRDNLKGLRVAIQGVGSVGYRLAEYLHKEGAELWVSDVNAASVQLAVDNLGAKAVNGDDIFSLDVDVLAPCALGGAINGETIKLLKTSIIAGGANNQLLLPEFGDILHKQGVLYAPDFVINAGGIIDCYYLTTHKPYSDMRKHVAEIGNTLSEIFTLSDQSDEATSVIANRMAEQRFMRTS
jgi:leucine dehydrogenase